MITLKRKTKKRKNCSKNKAKKIKSDNCIGSNRENSNITIAKLENVTDPNPDFNAELNLAFSTVRGKIFDLSVDLRLTLH